jgi:hypothetical protein
VIPLLLPDSIDRATLQDFIDMRAEKGKPLTPRGLKRLLNKLHRLEEQGHCPNLLMERSIMSGNQGWQDVYPDESTKRAQTFVAVHSDRSWADGL